MTEIRKPARVRVAPSPTGHMHLATARTALYNYLLAKQTGGKFILRVEDTDLKRTVPGAEQEIMDGLRWLGLNYDEGPDVGGDFGPYRQTERREIYTEHARRLVEAGFAYPCFCSAERLDKVRQQQQKDKQAPHYDGLCRRIEPEAAAARAASGERHVIRFKIPAEGKTVARDLLRGEIVVENSNIDDYVLLKSDGLPTYHLAVIVDDHLMKITHVLRGAEWLSTLPLHVNLCRAFGWDEPVWVHLSLFLNPSGKGKLSKRDGAQASKDGYTVFVKDLQGLGFIPEGVLNWVALMGWGVADEDVLRLNDMIEQFALERLTVSPAAINFAKLDHFNATHIRLLSDADIGTRIKPFFAAAGLETDDGTLLKVAALVKERMTTLDDAVTMAGFFFRPTPKLTAAELVGKDLTARQSLEVVEETLKTLEGVDPFEAEAIEPWLRGLAERMSLSAGQAFGVLRMAVTGQKISPPLFESMELLGRKAVLERLRAAQDTLAPGAQGS